MTRYQRAPPSKRIDGLCADGAAIIPFRPFDRVDFGSAWGTIIFFFPFFRRVYEPLLSFGQFYRLVSWPSGLTLHVAICI